MKFKIGDEVIICDDTYADFGQVETIEAVLNGIAWTKVGKIGYYATTGAGWLGKENGNVIIRKLTKLDKILK